MVIALQVEFHVEHDAHIVQSFHGLHQGIGFFAGKGKAVDPDAAVAVRLREYFKGVAPYFLVGVPLATKGMVNKNAVIFPVGDPAMRKGLVTLIQAPQAFACKIIARSQDKVACADHFFQGIDL